MWPSAVVAIRLCRRRLEGLKPLSLWERGWGEGFTLLNFRSYVANLLINIIALNALTPAPSPRGERGVAVTRSGIAVSKNASYLERLCHTPCLVKGDARVLAGMGP